jgi:hypothetical protein
MLNEVLNLSFDTKTKKITYKATNLKINGDDLVKTFNRFTAFKDFVTSTNDKKYTFKDKKNTKTNPVDEFVSELAFSH